MRYKTLVTAKLENLSNSLSTLNHMVNQGTTRDQVENWFTVVREKLDDIKTLINSEPDQQEGTW